ncbi:MAG TPA: glycosyltransferase [Dehalococcoidia bacterium]|nr:glycosyltransferase [Dehalococcoidia bacterium]
MPGELPGRPLRLAVLANFDSPHAWRWIKVFIARGHDVHAISYYPPGRELPGAVVHALASSERGPAGARGEGGPVRRAASRIPPSLMRLANALRFRRAGLSRLLAEIKPDLLHAHYVVEHGFYAAMSGFEPLVLSAWGSDLYNAPRTPAGAAIARYALRRAALVTGNDPALVREAVHLGVPAERAAVIRLGLDRDWLDAPLLSVNAGRDSSPPTVASTRALEPLYNIDVVLRAFALLRRRLPSARLVVANDGSQRPRLERLAAGLGLGFSVSFIGQASQARLRELLNASHVYVSVPSSDSFPLSTMEAMTAGAFPVVSDLPSQDGWITHGVNGLRVPVRDIDALATSLHLALTDDVLRRGAVEPNRERVRQQGDLERNMLLMERHYYRVAGHPLAEGAI